jgi:hypothetical protein
MCDVLCCAMHVQFFGDALAVPSALVLGGAACAPKLYVAVNVTSEAVPILALRAFSRYVLQRQQWFCCFC